MLFKTVLIITGSFAGLCAGGIPLWILGIPGVEGSYATGWKKGLATLFVYPALWLLCGAPYFFLRNRLDDAARAQWQLGTAIALVIICLGAVMRFAQAFRIMGVKEQNAKTEN